MILDWAIPVDILLPNLYKRRITKHTAASQFCLLPVQADSTDEYACNQSAIDTPLGV